MTKEMLIFIFVLIVCAFSKTFGKALEKSENVFTIDSTKSGYAVKIHDSGLTKSENVVRLPQFGSNKSEYAVRTSDFGSTKFEDAVRTPDFGSTYLGSESFKFVVNAETSTPIPESSTQWTITDPTTPSKLKPTAPTSTTSITEPTTSTLKPTTPTTTTTTISPTTGSTTSVPTTTHPHHHKALIKLIMNFNCSNCSIYL